jgi:hypothetical protein
MENSDNTDTILIKSLFESYGFTQHVYQPTHKKGHTLDIAITRDSDTLLAQPPYVIDPVLCNQHGDLAGDHYAIQLKINLSKPARPRKQVSFRKTRNICIRDFAHDIMHIHALNDTNRPLDDLVDAYNSSLKALMDKHAPLCTKVITLRPNAPWYSVEVREAKHKKRRWERLWRRTSLTIHQQLYKEHCRDVNKLLYHTKRSYFTKQIAECGTDQKRIYMLTN